MDEKEKLMIRAADGYYWLVTTGEDGRQRSSYCGYLGATGQVQAWCEQKGIEFRDMSTYEGRLRSGNAHHSASVHRTRRQAHSGRNRSGLVASHPACPA